MLEPPPDVSVPPVPLGPGTGTVVEFDDPRGIGVVATASGVRLGFHCTAIADGTRRIAVGTVVTFRPSAGRRGRFEALDLRPDPAA